MAADKQRAAATDRLADTMAKGMTGGGLADLAREMADSNDLWPAASSIAPELADRRQVLEQATAWRWALSGSGPSLFCILPTLEEAIEAGRRLAADRPPELAGVMLTAVDLDNPDNAWREP
jgi:4-diphosphocytidyl-2C-methyl-D-erythritol kinase